MQIKIWFNDTHDKKWGKMCSLHLYCHQKCKNENVTAKIYDYHTFAFHILHTNADPHIWTSVMNTNYETIQTFSKVIRFVVTKMLLSSKAMEQEGMTFLPQNFVTLILHNSLCNNRRLFLILGSRVVTWEIILWIITLLGP